MQTLACRRNYSIFVHQALHDISLMWAQTARSRSLIANMNYH